VPAAMFDGPGDDRIRCGHDPTPGAAALLGGVHRALTRGPGLETDRRHPTIGHTILPAPGRETA
jgi:hypothetical protein